MCDAIYLQAMELRKRIRENQGDEEAKRQLESLSRSASERCKLQPKTPMEAPRCLFYFSDSENEALLSQEDELMKLITVKEITSFRSMIFDEVIEGGGTKKKAVDIGSIPWTEDYLHIYEDGTVGTMLPFDDSDNVVNVLTEGQRLRLGDENPLYKVLTTSFTCTQNVYMPEEHPGHCFLRSIIEGGNILTGSDFALIGRDSLYATCVQNGISEDEARELIAMETGYDKEELYFVEQPGTYHLDLNMLLLGKDGNGNKRVLVNNEYKKVSLNCIHDELKDYGFEVIVDEAEIVGKVDGEAPKQRNYTASPGWLYNFYNGEFVYGRDGKLYYVTNGIATQKKQDNSMSGEIKWSPTDEEIQQIQTTFENFLQAYVPAVEKVIYCKKMTAALLNHTHGGVGCRFKGGPDKLL